jgi:hypothetical protein
LEAPGRWEILRFFGTPRQPVFCPLRLGL